MVLNKHLFQFNRLFYLNNFFIQDNFILIVSLFILMTFSVRINHPMLNRYVNCVSLDIGTHIGMSLISELIGITSYVMHHSGNERLLFYCVVNTPRDVVKCCCKFFIKNRILKCTLHNMISLLYTMKLVLLSYV